MFWMFVTLEGRRFPEKQGMQDMNKAVLKIEEEMKVDMYTV